MSSLQKRFRVGVWVLNMLKDLLSGPSAFLRVNSLVFLPRRSADWEERLSKVIVDRDLRSFISIPRMFVSFVWPKKLANIPPCYVVLI